MFLLGFHIVSIALLIFVVGVIAYRKGLRMGARRAIRAMEESQGGA